MEAKYTHGAMSVMKDGHTMFISDVVGDLNRKSYLEAENKKLKEDIKRYVPSTVIREGIDLRARNKELEEAIAEKQSLFDLQHRRTLAATLAWQKETGKDCWPDLGKLVGWLMEKAKLC